MAATLPGVLGHCCGSSTGLASDMDDMPLEVAQGLWYIPSIKYSSVWPGSNGVLATGVGRGGAGAEAAKRARNPSTLDPQHRACCSNVPI